MPLSPFVVIPSSLNCKGRYKETYYLPLLAAEVNFPAQGACQLAADR